MNSNELNGDPLPKIAVLLSAYNEEDKISDTINSIINQTYKSLKIYLVDDFSSDSTAYLMECYKTDRRIKVISNKFNKGLTKSLYDTVKIIKEPYIARIDSGDFWRPDKIEKQVKELLIDPNIVLIGTQTDYYDTISGTQGRSNFPISDLEIRKAFFYGRGVNSHSMIIFKNILNYRKEMLYSQDLDLYMRLAEFGKVICLNEVLGSTQISSDGISSRKKALQMTYINICYLNLVRRTQGREESFNRNDKIFLKKFLYRISQPTYKKYIKSSHNKEYLAAYLFLIFSCIVNPYFLIGYLNRATRYLFIEHTKLYRGYLKKYSFQE